MEASLRRSSLSDGFTLIELMVVVMVIAVLIAIAIPSFLGFRASAQDRAAQATLTTAEKVAYLVILEEGIIPSRATLLVLLPTMEPSTDWIDHRDSPRDLPRSPSTITTLARSWRWRPSLSLGPASTFE